jgi:HEAT repeat protein
MRSLRVAAWLAAAVAAAAPAQPRISNAQVETRAVQGGLEQEFQRLVSSTAGPAWIGYAVAAVEGQHGGDDCRCSLEGDRQESGSARLEGSRELLVLYRVEQKAVGRIRFFSGDCQIDGGGVRVYWLTGVQGPDSVRLLSSFVPGKQDRLMDSAIAAIALHADAAADRALEQFAAAGQPERVREKTSFWLGAARGKRGYELLRRIVKEDPSRQIREKAVFALSISRAPEAVDTLIEIARKDADGHVRGQALFWLGQKAGKKAAAALTDAVENDPDTEVKKRAVFGLSQMKEEGVPLLIQVAKTNRNPAVRKQAIFWLGQSRDPRALDFFEQLLKN